MVCLVWLLLTLGLASVGISRGLVWYKVSWSCGWLVGFGRGVFRAFVFGFMIAALVICVLVVVGFGWLFGLRLMVVVVDCGFWF